MDEYSINITSTIGITRSPDSYIFIPCENQNKNGNLFCIYLKTNVSYVEQNENKNEMKVVVFNHEDVKMEYLKT